MSTMQGRGDTGEALLDLSARGPASAPRRPRPALSHLVTPNAPPAGKAAADDEEGGADIAKTLNVLWRGKWIVLLLALLGASLAYVYAKQQTPIYAARALLMFEERQEQVIDIERVVSGLDVSSSAVASQIEVILSDQLARRVADKLRLERDPEFNTALVPHEPGLLRGLIASLSPDVEAAIYGATAEEGLVTTAAAAQVVANEAQQRAVIARLRSGLQVAPRGRSFVIEVGFESPDPRKAALIANTVADQYIVDQLEAKFEATRRATLWLNERLGDLKSRVEETERAVEDYRASITAASGQGVELTSQQLSALNASLIQARADSAEARARFENVSRLVASGRDASNAAQVLGASSVAEARSKLSELQRQEAELSTRYGPKHPRIINIRAEITDVSRTIRGETTKVVETLRNELEVAEARVQSLQESVVALEGRSLDQGQAMVRLRELEREAEANRLIYQEFLARFKETSAQEELQTPDARVIARADTPGAPARPNVQRTLMIGGALGVMLGLGIIFLLESVNNTFRTKEQMESLLDLPVLAAVPKLGVRKKRSDLYSYLRRNPNSALAESIRSFRTSLLLSNIDATPRIVLVTSAIPSEGKSSLSLMLAMTSAGMGKKTLLVECDLRRPTVKDVFAPNGQIDIVSVLSGEAALSEALVADIEDERLDALPGLRAKGNPADIFSSDRFRALIEKLSETYDMVVLDSPPVLPVADARILSEIADVTVLATRWDETPRDVVADALRQLRNVNAVVAGGVLTMVDPQRQSAYYGRYGRYGRDYGSAYYSS